MQDECRTRLDAYFFSILDFCTQCDFPALVSEGPFWPGGGRSDTPTTTERRFRAKRLIGCPPCNWPIRVFWFLARRRIFARILPLLLLCLLQGKSCSKTAPQSASCFRVFLDLSNYLHLSSCALVIGGHGKPGQKAKGSWGRPPADKTPQLKTDTDLNYFRTCCLQHQLLP